ncbi:MAG: ACP S-malonyltransferase [Candidatus Orphnella occulta]|nr:ACP S-malonyltransferase [Candidatus Orphnella occulta]MDP8297211.1 ACP S-malonyltransferase [Candidatus Orphnella occulta]
MVETAFIFPGQGAQYVGMGKALYKKHDIVKKTYDQANDILKFDLARLCFEGPSEELTKTQNCQVAILVTSIAVLRAHLLERSEFTPQVALGLSLGEYTALVAAESLAFSDAVKLVRLRGQFMEDVSRSNPGKMASLLGLDLKNTEKICEETGAEIANLNCPGQIVISGALDVVDKAVLRAKEAGAKRAIILDVSGPFHSALMAEASHKLKEALDDVVVLPPKIPVISNVMTYAQDDPGQIKENLVDQISSTTFWEESVKNVVSRGITTFLEIGPGTVLKGLLRRIDPEIICHNISA